MMLSCVVNRESTTTPRSVVWKYLLPLSVLPVEMGVWWEKLELGWHCCSSCSTTETQFFPLHGLGWDGKLNFFAVQNKIVMGTAKIREFETLDLG